MRRLLLPLVTFLVIATSCSSEEKTSSNDGDGKEVENLRAENDSLREEVRTLRIEKHGASLIAQIRRIEGSVRYIVEHPQSRNSKTWEELSNALDASNEILGRLKELKVEEDKIELIRKHLTKVKEAIDAVGELIDGVDSYDDVMAIFKLKELIADNSDFDASLDKLISIASTLSANGSIPGAE